VADLTATVARAYFEGLAARDWDAVTAAWADGGAVRVVGKRKLHVPDQWRAFVEAIDAAFPDLRMELVDVEADSEMAAARWRLRGYFTGPFEGVEPTGAGAEIDVCELVRVRDGIIDRSTVVLECGLLAAQLGVAPWMIAEPEPEHVADGVWLLRGGYPMRSMNVFLLEDPDGGVTLFDAGIRAMAEPIADAAAPLGGVARIVLGHGHSDHRATAKSFGAPVLCHPDEVADAEGDGGEHYMDLGKLSPPARWVMNALLASYDGPPPTISGTVEEGDVIAGFEVIHLPGHAPGLIGLYRGSDRLALVSDAVYLTDMEAFGKPAAPQIPHRATTWDHDRARESIRKLAALDAATVWPGHLGPITGDVRGQLERAAQA
jgi:glyoxylase-like metal-dependent hydrolase (beta-lactamase superfamily II)/predicted ester cyclase